MTQSLSPGQIPPAPMPPAPGQIPPEPGEGERIRAVASSQKLIIYAIALNFVVVFYRFATITSGVPGSSPVQLALYMAVLLVSIGVAVLSLIGVYRLATALGYSTGLKVLFLVLMFVPLASLLAMLISNERATKTLRAAGYRVGLLGAEM